MNKPSGPLWLLMLTVASVLGWRLTHKPPPRFHETVDVFSGVKSTLGMFAVDCGRYPTTAEGLHALITCPTNISSKLWKGPYLVSPKLLRDPWGHEYVYRRPGIHNTNGYDLYSTGPDGISNDSDDIGNWQPHE